MPATVLTIADDPRPGYTCGNAPWPKPERLVRWLAATAGTAGMEHGHRRRTITGCSDRYARGRTSGQVLPRNRRASAPSTASQASTLRDSRAAQGALPLIMVRRETSRRRSPEFKGIRTRSVPGPDTQAALLGAFGWGALTLSDRVSSSCDCPPCRLAYLRCLRSESA
jgi:hypothetical protein